jgi:hypothetical protein
MSGNGKGKSAPKLRRDPKNARKPAPPAPAPPAEKHRPTRGEVEQRVNSIVTMIATRSRHEEIVRFGSSQWGITSRQTDKYIRRANAIILAEAAKDRATRIAEHLAALDAIVKRAYAIDDLASMRAAIAEKSKLCGDYPVVKTVLQIDKMSDEQLANEVNKLVIGLGIRLEPPDGEGLQAEASGNGNGKSAGQ